MPELTIHPKLHQARRSRVSASTADPDHSMSPLGAKLLTELHLEVLDALGDEAAGSLHIERAVVGVFSLA